MLSDHIVGVTLFKVSALYRFDIKFVPSGLLTLRRTAKTKF